MVMGSALGGWCQRTQLRLGRLYGARGRRAWGTRAYMDAARTPQERVRG
jgi:hypothetical protein